MPVFNPVRALERGLEILQAVNERDGMRTQDIARMTDLPRPTVFRLLETLQGMGFVMQSPSDDTWHPTLRCNVLSSGFLDKAWVGQIAVPEMTKLGKKILWPLDLITFQDCAMMIRETTHKVSPFSFDVGMVGTLIPMLHTAGGHAYLAFCPDEEREEILSMMRNTGKPEHELAHDPVAIQQILDRTRAQGFGSRTVGYKGHTNSISMPIYRNDRPIAALTVVCLKSALSYEEMVRKFATRLRRTCDQIGAEVTRTAGDT